jgi:hypothetical protein
MRPPILTDEEREGLHASDVPPEDRTKDDWWKRYVEVRSYLRRKEFQAFQNQHGINEGPVLSVVVNDPVEVELTDGSVTQVCMASYDRIMLVENFDFLIKAIQVARASVMEDPASVADFRDTLDRLQAEESRAFQLLIAQVCAPGPEPLDIEEPPKWCSKLTTADGKAILSAWRIVNLDRPLLADEAIKAKWPVKKKKDTSAANDSLGGFSFLFLSVAWRERIPVRSVMRDRALASLLTEYLAHGQQELHHKEKAEAKKPKPRK